MVSGAEKLFAMEMMYNRCNTENTEHYSDALEPTNMCIVVAMCIAMPQL